MNKNSSMRKWCLGFSLSSAALLASATSFARSAPASLGQSLSLSGCVTETNFGGAVKNNDKCGTETYRIPLVTDWAGRDNVLVYGSSGNRPNNLTCQAFSMTNGEGSWVTWSWSPRVTVDPAATTPVVLSLPVDIPAHGAAYVDCAIGPGSWISVVEW